MIEIGDKVTFHYPDFGAPDGYPEHRAHSGQTVTVVEEVIGAYIEQGEHLYKVRAEDGWIGEAWESELGEATFQPHDPTFCGCAE